MATADVLHVTMPVASDPRAEATLHVFVRLLGVPVGHHSLTKLPFGGIYLVGGVSRVIAPYLDNPDFVEAL